MRPVITYLTKSLLVLVMLFGLSIAQPAWASEGNIDDTYKYAWSENAGWVNFRPAHGGVSVYASHLTGHAWGENIGWIKLGNEEGGPYFNSNAQNWGVNHNGFGNLSGYAWSETAGWISFNTNDSQVTIDSEGGFEGYAWSENVGWIHFKDQNPGYQVRTNFNPSTEGYPDDDGFGCFISTLVGRSHER